MKKFFALAALLLCIGVSADAQNIQNYPQTNAVTQSLGDNSTFIATDAFVAAATAGLNPAVEVNAATTVAGDTSGFTYNNGTAGVGATLTGSVNTAVTIDGFTFTATSQRLLVKNDTVAPSNSRNGVYTLTTLQAGGVAPVFTRATDYNVAANIDATGTIPVLSGSTNAGTLWYLTTHVVTIGTDPISYAQFTSGSGNGTINVASNAQCWAGTRNKIIDANVAQTCLIPTVLTVSSHTFTADLSTGINFSVTLETSACSCTMANPTHVWAGASGFIEIIQPASGGPATITTWSGNWKFSGGTKPTLSTAANAKDIVPFFCDATNFCMVGAIQTAFQ